MTNAAHKLMMSQTLLRLNQLAQSMPTDVHNPDELKGALSICSVELIDALDNSRIHFDKADDKAMFLGLLAVVTDYVMDGRLKGNTQKATIN